MACILMLDDSPLVLSATKGILERAGHKVFAVTEPPRFFSLLTAEQPELALVDVSMPMLQGDAVVWIARAHQLHACQIVLYSAKAPEELEKLVASSGADGFICKTMDNEELLSKVDGFLSRKSPVPRHAPG